MLYKNNDSILDIIEKRRKELKLQKLINEKIKYEKQLNLMSKIHKNIDALKGTLYYDDFNLNIVEDKFSNIIYNIQKLTAEINYIKCDIDLM